MFNKNINNNQKKPCLQKLFALLFLFLVTSCNDYGCIDADDFGEYESYTFRVESSRLGEYCTYKDGFNLASQPIGLRNCINSKSSCSGALTKDCGEACADECRADPVKTLTNIGLAPGATLASGQAEPLWTSVGGSAEKNVSIEHNSQILITAQGTLDLGNEVEKSTVFINQSDTGKEDWNLAATTERPNIAKFSGKENINITIQGKFNDDLTEDYFKSRTADPDITIDYNDINYFNQEFANGARRIFAYFIPSPPLPSEFKEFPLPLTPDPSKWQCSISDEYLACSTKDNCSESDKTKCDLYERLLPTSVTNVEQRKAYNLYFSKFFNVDNLTKETSRYNNGTGFIRYKGDNLTGTNFAVTGVNLTVKNLWQRLNFPNNQEDYAIKFTHSEGINCAGLKYRFDGVNVLKEYNVDINAAGATTPKVYVINKKDLGSFDYRNDLLNNDENCEVKISFYKFHEIEFSESGYIEFGIPNEVFPTSANCNLKFKIFNKGAGKDEFANFLYPVSTVSTASTKYHTAVEDQSTHPILSGATNNPKKYFIRKGQTLSFHPDSWNGKWTPRIGSADADIQDCGVGFYVKLTPRPAVFCSNILVKEFININQDKDPLNNCKNPYYNESLKKYIGCQPDTTLCASGANFCPSECIYRDFSTCRPSTVLSSTILFPPSTSCTPTDPQNICYQSGGNPASGACGSSSEPANCKTYDYFLTIEPYKSITPNKPTSASMVISCAACKADLKTQVISPFFKKTDIGLQQCYDLENYTGTMEELKNKLGLLIDIDKSLEAYNILEDAVPAGLKAKGLKKLETFDGNYGNFYPLAYTGKDEIYKIKNLISVGRQGYLKFIILNDIPIVATNPDYFEIADSGTRGITMTPPLRVNIKSSNELSNGQGLTIALCKEGSATATNCSGSNTLSVQKATFGSELALPIIEENGDANTLSNYKFNDFGQLIRIKEIGSMDASLMAYQRECTSSENIWPRIDANFLCFRDYGNVLPDPTSPQALSNNNKYRLTFKIFDNETPSCKVSSGSNFTDCIPTSSSDPICNKFKMYNQDWDGEQSGYCPTSTSNPPPECKKNYKCITDKYANNQGHYDVAVRIKKGSKVQVSNFIDSIISPILGQVDGFYKTDKVVYDKNDLRISTYLTESPTITNVPTQLIAKDSKIIGHDIIFPPMNDTLQTIALKCPDAYKNCFISYIIKAVLIYDNPGSCPPADIIVGVRSSCEGYVNCSFLASKSSIQYSTGVSLYSISSCKINKVVIEYAFSRSDKPLYKENQVRRIYNSILVNPVYKSFLTLSIVLMLSFYGMGFLMGVSELKQSEIVDRLIKIAIIYLFTNPDFGWVWFEKFFVTFFKNGIDFLTFTMAGIFDENAQIESAIQSGNFSNKSLIFAGVDRVIHLLLINDVIHKKIGALMFYKFFGILYVMIIYYSAIAYVYAVSNAVLLYLTSQFFTSVLFIVGPIFFVFILFKQSKGFFDNWLNALIGFGLQQIFIIFTLSLFNTMLYMVIKLTLGFRVCWDSVWQMHLPGGINISILSFWTPQDAPPYLGETMNPSAEGSSGSIPTIPRLLSLWTICVIMKSFIAQIANLATLLSGGISASELGSSVASGMNNIVDQAQKKWGDLYKKSGAKIIERADQRLFDSGDLAKKARKKAKDADSRDSRVIDTMNKAGDKGVSDYKIKNAEKYAGMTEGQKREKLNEVKKEYMKESAKSMGRPEKEIERLMNRSGSKYHGDNVFGAMMSMTKDRFHQQNNSLNAKALDVKTGMSSREMNKTLQRMDNAGARKAFIEDIKNGNIQEKQKSTKNPLTAYGEGKAKAEERQIAINQLEKTGDIPRITSTFQPENPKRTLLQKAVFIATHPGKSIKAALSERSAGAEEKILERIGKNRNEQSFGGGEKADPKKINKLEAFASYLQIKEGKNTREDQRKAENDLTNAKNNPDKGSIKKIEEESNKAIREKLNDQRGHNDIDKAKAQEKVNSSEGELGKIQASIDGNRDHSEMDYLSKKINKKEGAPDEIKKFNELKEKDQNQPNKENTFAEKNKQRSLTKIQLANNNAELDNYKIKEEKIDEALKKVPKENQASDHVGASTDPAQSSSAPQPPSVPDPANAPPVSSA